MTDKSSAQAKTTSDSNTKKKKSSARDAMKTRVECKPRTAETKTTGYSKWEKEAFQQHSESVADSTRKQRKG